MGRASASACFLQLEIGSDFPRENSRHLASVGVLDRRFKRKVQFPMGAGFPGRSSSGAEREWILSAAQGQSHLLGRVLSLPAQRSSAQLSSLLAPMPFAVTGLTLPISIEPIIR